MMLRRYGNRVHSVRPNFDVLAITEIGFRRDHEVTIDADAFEAHYLRIRLHELTATAEGDVQREVEEALLTDLGNQLQSIEGALGADEALLIENAAGPGAAKALGKQKTIVVADENRYHFQYSVQPPLQVGVYRKRSAS
jgi:hypothetical protein